MAFSIPYVDLPAQWAEEKAALKDCFERVLSSGILIGGPEIEAFEADLAALCGSRHAVALNSGTDALRLAMVALGIGSGDEVITPANSFVASTSSIIHTGANPVFADVLDDQNIDPNSVLRAITPRTKAIMAVHLTGRIADMDALQDIARSHKLLLIEDAAQAVGSRRHGRPAGSLGDIGCFSMHPLKNLNAAGDAGAVVTQDAGIAERLRRLRNHGLEGRDLVTEFGWVSRMDPLQAILLRFRLTRLAGIIERRRRNAGLYRQLLDAKQVFVPPCAPGEFNTFHTFVIQVDQRDELRSHLAANGIEALIHYPVPIHLQPAAAHLGWKPGSLPMVERQARRILSLPVHQHLQDEDLFLVAEMVNGFYSAQ
jgi:dTDP-4-amino-4,6-dideoxygalactose transaminase